MFITNSKNVYCFDNPSTVVVIVHMQILSGFFYLYIVELEFMVLSG